MFICFQNLPQENRFPFPITLEVLAGSNFHHDGIKGAFKLIYRASNVKWQEILCFFKTLTLLQAYWFN